MIYILSNAFIITIDFPKLKLLLAQRISYATGVIHLPSVYFDSDYSATSTAYASIA